MRIIFKYCTSLIAISITAYLVYQATTIALADISHYPVKSAIAKSNQKNPLSLEMLDSLRTKILYSIELRPNNGEYREYLGRLYYLKAIHYQDTASLFLENMQLAYRSHRKASQLRPNWPYSWANMALIKSHLNQFDAGFIYSFNQAEKFGPWELSSNINIVQAGFNGWPLLSPKTQAQVIKALERIHEQQPYKAKDLLGRYQLAKTICSLLNNEKLKGAWVCQKESAKHPLTTQNNDLYY